MTRAAGLSAILAVLATATAVCLVHAPAARADVVWLCEPGMESNPCEISQDTTLKEFGMPDRTFTPPNGPREIDCFYVYPTVSNQTTANADKSRDPEIESIAKYQAARFNTQCRIYAPIYRQGTLASIGAGTAGSSPADPLLAYGDVLEAWRDYLASDNKGRPVVLIGHSQGTGMLRRLLKLEIEKHPSQLRRIVSAILLGGNVTVPEGEIVGGDFKRTPLCTQPAQVACVVAYSTFAMDPPENPRFGKSNPPAADSPLPGGPGFEIACTDPYALGGMGEEDLRILTPTEPYAPGPIAAGIVITSNGAPPSAATTWVVAPDRATGGCTTINGANVLRYEPLAGSRRPTFFPDPTWGTHLIDVNLALDPLTSLVEQQAKRWTEPDIRLRRRCLTEGRLRVRLIGSESEFVRKVAFSVGKRRVARDSQPAFVKTLRRSVLAAGRGSKLRAKASLSEGAPPRVKLARRLPSCG